MGNYALDNGNVFVVFLFYNIHHMKNNVTSPGFSIQVAFKFLVNAFKSIFESGDNREFKRLKDFIAS